MAEHAHEAALAGLASDIAREIEAHDAFDCPEGWTYVRAANAIATRLVERFVRPAPAPSSQSERIAVLEEALAKVKHWAESRCPCHNEEPNPCPLCGASVENLEACKSAENTLPRDVLEAVRNASARSALAPLGEE